MHGGRNFKRRLTVCPLADCDGRAVTFLGCKDFLTNTLPDVALFRLSRKRQRAASAPVDRQPQKDKDRSPAKRPNGPARRSGRIADQPASTGAVGKRDQLAFTMIDFHERTKSVRFKFRQPGRTGEWRPSAI